MDELKEFLEALAAKETYQELDEDFNPMDWFGGNFDDTYFGGVNDGRIKLAKELLNKYFK
jgi:hypothetical protein